MRTAGVFSRSELRQLLNRTCVQDTLRKAEMEGVDTEELVSAIIKARDEWRHEQWPYGPEHSEDEAPCNELPCIC